MENTERLVSNKKPGRLYAIGAVVLAVLGGIVWYFFPREEVYDLPIFMWILAAVLIFMGLNKILSKKQVTGREMVSFSRDTVKRFMLDKAIMISLLVLVVVIAVMEPRFMQIRVVLDILTQSSPWLIIALGICFTLLIAGTDLSAGRMVGLAAVISASMLQNPDYANRFFPNMPQLAVIIPILIAIAACMAFGAVNGFLWRSSICTRLSPRWRCR